MARATAAVVDAGRGQSHHGRRSSDSGSGNGSQRRRRRRSRRRGDGARQPSLDASSAGAAFLSGASWARGEDGGVQRRCWRSRTVGGLVRQGFGETNGLGGLGGLGGLVRRKGKRGTPPGEAREEEDKDTDERPETGGWTEKKLSGDSNTRELGGGARAEIRRWGGWDGMGRLTVEELLLLGWSGHGILGRRE